MKKKDIEILNLKTSTHQQTLAKETVETNEMQAAIASLAIQRDTHLATRETLKQQIVETQKAIDTRIAAQRIHAQHLDSQSRHNVPELDFWLSNLCVRIEGAGMNDLLKFVFTHIDERDWTREASFEVNAGRRDYTIEHCRPKLESDRVERVLEKLNETRELGPFLKGMRELFVEAMKA